MKTYDLKFLLDKKSKQAGAYYLSHTPKNGRMTTSTLQLEMANRYVYEAFQPLLEKKSISKKDFLNNESIKKDFRSLYITALFNAREHSENFIDEHPNWYGKNVEIDIDEFTKHLKDITEKWVEFKQNLNRNPKSDKNLEALREQVKYLGFFATDSKTRNLLLKVSKDQNRAEDKIVFKNLEKYITTKESIDYEQYMDSPELRELYREKYETIKAELEQDQNPARYSYETSEEAIQRISQEWANVAAESKDISQETYERFTTEYPLETFSKLTPLEIANLERQTIKIKQIICDQQHQQIMAERMQETEQLAELSQIFGNDVSDSFNQAMTTRTANPKESFSEIMKATIESQEKESAPRKK